jgi:hypothetical protein
MTSGNETPSLSDKLHLSKKRTSLGALLHIPWHQSITVGLRLDFLPADLESILLSVP